MKDDISAVPSQSQLPGGPGHTSRDLIMLTHNLFVTTRHDQLVVWDARYILEPGNTGVIYSSVARFLSLWCILGGAVTCSEGFVNYFLRVPQAAASVLPKGNF